MAGPNPYIFLTVPKGRSQSLLQAFEVLEDNDEEEKDNEAADIENDDDDAQEIMDDDDDEEQDAKDSLDKEQLEENIDADNDDDDELDNVMSMNLKLRKSNGQIHNAKPTQMMITREHAGAILVPDEVIEIEGQSVIDEKTGKPAVLLPRSILDAIPDGSVVALMERSSDVDEQAEERANRVIVRRRRKGARRNIRRRRGNRRRGNRRGVNNRRRVNRRKNVRVIRRGGNKRRRVNRRRVSLQG